MVAIGLLAATVSACENTTEYVRRNPDLGFRYGYRDKALGGDEYSVSVLGSPKTDAARVERIALLRAAHLTLAKKRTHFVIVASDSRPVTSARLQTVPIIFPGIVTAIPVGERLEEEHMSVLVIRLLPLDAVPGEDARDAEAVVEELAPEFDGS